MIKGEGHLPLLSFISIFTGIIFEKSETEYEDSDRKRKRRNRENYGSY
jgi:hypothetical protein